MIFRCFFEFSSCQLQAGRTNSRVAHSSLSLHKFDELNEIRNRIHAEQRQEPAIQLKGFNPAGNGIQVGHSRGVTLDTCSSSGNSGKGLSVDSASDVSNTTGAFNNDGGELCGGNGRHATLLS